MRRLLVLVALLAVVGCEGGRPAQRRDQGAENAAPSIPSSGSPSPGPASGTGCMMRAAGQVEAGSVLIPGPVNGVPASDAGGERLTITATVLDPGCRPASRADVRLWHTDARGLYAPPGSQNECCFFGGTVRTDQNGRFRIETIRPAEYPEQNGQAAHIHFEIGHASGQLDTEIVFESGAPTTGPVGPSHVLPIRLRTAAGGWSAEATFVLQPGGA
jgi:protocatechuate 3,4-dioxygenase beta subunit